MLTIKFIIKFINLLNKDATPRALAGGMALGAIIGITPFASLHNLVVLILILMLTVNFSGAILAMGVFKAFSFLFDPLFNKVGYALLTNEGLKGLWTALYNTPVVPWTKFNNTLTLGSLVCALILFLPLYFFLVWAIVRYRETLMVRIQKLKIMQIMKASKLFNLYRTFSSQS